MSMLKAFFEIGADKSLFKSLYIAGNDKLCAEHMGKYPVIFITLKGVEGLDFDSAKRKLINIIAEAASEHSFLADSPQLSDEDKARYQSLKALINGR